MVPWASTGFKGLDSVLSGLQKGDNVVWQVDNINDYRCFVSPFVTQAMKEGRKIVYVRFADHKPLLEPDSRITTYNLSASSGFESFSAHVHGIISDEGKEVFYVFDCLSDLLNSWATDLMIGNFFLATCPYLFDLDTIAYFALRRNSHSYKTVARIRETTQLLLDLYNFEENFYIHPLKVWKRYSPTMFLPHLKQGEQFVPITNSVDAAHLVAYISEQGLEPAQRTLDYWDRLFLRAKDLSEIASSSELDRQQTAERLCRIMIGREKKMLTLAQKHLALEDLLNIKNRLIGTGFVGGKTVGMLIARSILANDKSFDWDKHLEPHDSFYVGSDVFYTYIVENGWWKQRMEHKTKEGYFKVAAELKEKMLHGKFPDQIREQFQEIIEYFGQSPIIIRSSSLLEDAFGNAFAGKYESFFCANQGTPAERYRNFEDIVRKVYASTMNEDALVYRMQRGLDQQDEQMALLVQRVSGSYHDGFFFPDLAGVGVSRNTFVWNPQLDPQAGMLRIVFGLGTRAVNRVDDDYPRLVALDAPLLRPVGGMDDIRRFSQHKADLLDIAENTFKTVDVQKLLDKELNIKVKDLIALPDTEATDKARQLGMEQQQYWILTFDKFLSDSTFVKTMQQMLKLLEDAYRYPVDIEFTVNFTDDKEPVINLLQCRPLQTKGIQPVVKLPTTADAKKILLRCEGYYMGSSMLLPVKRVIYVDPQEYVKLPLTQKYDIARVVGKLNKQIEDRQAKTTILIGPGRWGTTTPSLGVPVSFSEINNVTLLAEIAYEGGNLMPELSFGTHFFQDLVESDISYVAVFPQKKNVILNKELLQQKPNLLPDLLPESAKYANVIIVYEPDKDNLQLVSDAISQKLICHLK